MLLERMMKNLTTPSIFSRKYGLLSKEEAEEDAKQIEGMAFATANQHFEKEPDGDGSSAVQLYAKESSKLMLDVLKRGPITKEIGEVKIFEEVKASYETIFDISGSRRAFIDAEEAEELLRPLSKPGNKYTKICFSNRSFGLDAAHVAKPILSSLKDQLTEVDLSDFIAGRPEDEALEVMNIFSSALEGCELRYLNLSNNALGEKGVRAFGGLLKSQRDEGAIAIAGLVIQSPMLENFQCSSTRVGSEGGVALAEALGICTHLKKLDLRDNMFGVESGVTLSKAVSGFADLTEKSAPSLEVLEMAGNDITINAAPALVACIAAKQFLTKLNLAENELKDDGAILIAKALEEGHDQLTEVDLSANSIRRAGARVLAQAVVRKPRFKLLNVNTNFISDEGVDELKDIFKNSPGVLGPLDENDPEGEDHYEDSEEEGPNNEIELESRLKDLKIKQEE
ncbi:hypothetical protein F0562_021268 [Nyssa sinensis]|uniref:WPP domain-containing protein n=1 Tax=Nyssa sinensis TaxID=561372 RepID=A0A5J5BN70_9ASTE|nr:hypothetical protein F0562_021268 [Nyssa sinensis]